MFGMARCGLFVCGSECSGETWLCEPFIAPAWSGMVRHGREIAGQVRNGLAGFGQPSSVDACLAMVRPYYPARVLTLGSRVGFLPPFLLPR